MAEVESESEDDPFGISEQGEVEAEQGVNEESSEIDEISDEGSILEEALPTEDEEELAEGISDDSENEAEAVRAPAGLEILEDEPSSEIG